MTREERVAVREPFRLDLTANVLRRLSTNVVDLFDGATYRRLIGDPADPSLITVVQTSADAIGVRIDGPDAARFDPQALATRLFGLDVDLSPFYRASEAIPWLAPLVRGARGVKPPRYTSVWEACVNAIVYQQISIHAAGAILRRVIERYTEPVSAGDAHVRAFPAPVTIADADAEELRGLGLSIQKIVAVRNVARAVIDGAIDEASLDRLPTPELMIALTGHKGIGPWTAAVIALRGFGRLDLFPMNDSGVARSVRDLSGASDVDVEELLGVLGPQRGMLYYHLLLGRLVARGDVELAATPPGL